ncbi:hypothetical protein BDV93DRAFT_522437 [Ceratobasidium sp. AG-I]|nr:hypothetical protein BDV93DRAFT_522437 [Ceratobasidium sp. AG-I]
MDPDSMLALMSVSRLIQRLTSVNLNQRFYVRNYYRGQEWLNQNLSLLLRHALSLKSFTYDAREIGPYGPPSSYEVQGSSLLQAISVLKLEHISLLYLRFPLEFMIDLAAACPSLVELRVPHSHMSDGNLHWFTRLPKLKRLALSFSFLDAPSNWHVPNGRLEILENTESCLPWSQPANVDRIATFLLSLWPNLRLVTWPFRNRLLANTWRDSRITKRVKEYWRFMDELNDLIQDKRLLGSEVGLL